MLTGPGRPFIEQTASKPALTRRISAFRALLLLSSSALVALWVSVAKDWEVPVLDDPIYAQVAFDFARTGQILLPDLSAPTAIFEAVWGGLFARAFGMTYGVLRVSSLVILFASIPALFCALRLLGTSRQLSALGTAAYVFNPMLFSISNTFMTDGHFLALLVIAFALIVRGTVREDHQYSFLLLGGVASGLAYLSRQQALVLPLAAALAFATSKGSSGWIRGALVGVPTIVTVAMIGLLSTQGEGPVLRSLSIQDVQSRTSSEVAAVAGITFELGVVFFGLFLVPVLPVLVRNMRVDKGRAVGPLLAGVGVGLIIFCANALINSRLALTHHDTWWSITGIGAVDRTYLGKRPALVPMVILGVLTVAAFFAAWASIWLASRSRKARQTERFIVLAILGFVGTSFLGGLAWHGAPLDRYWLPILPLALALTLPSLKSSRASFGAATVLTVVMTFVSIVGTRDAIVVTESSLALAEELTPTPIPLNNFDGGGPWMALNFGLPDVDPDIYPAPGPFWVAFFNPDLDPHYGIALEALEGYEVIERREYSSWLHLQPTYLYVVHRDPALPFYIRIEDW